MKHSVTAHSPSEQEAQLPMHAAVCVGQVGEGLGSAPAVDGIDGATVCHAGQPWI